MSRNLLSLDRSEMEPLARSSLSVEFRTVIDIHERAGGTVDVRWRDRVTGGIQVRLDGGAWTGCLAASESMAIARTRHASAIAA